MRLLSHLWKVVNHTLRSRFINDNTLLAPSVSVIVAIAAAEYLDSDDDAQ